MLFWAISEPQINKGFYHSIGDPKIRLDPIYLKIDFGNFALWTTIWQRAAEAIDQPSSAGCWTTAITKSRSLEENYWRILWKKRHANEPVSRRRRKKLDRKSNGSRQKNKRPDRKVESNDSPEIPDTGKTSDIPGLLSAIKIERMF